MSLDSAIQPGLAGLQIIRADWAQYRAQLAQVRTAVFVDEQGVPPEIEMDDQDVSCHHLLAQLDGEPIGTARLLADGRIGRLAVVRHHRATGVGRQLLQACIGLAESLGLQELYLHAQVQTLDFYRRAGFVDQGETFMEAGIRHQNMQISLT